MTLLLKWLMITGPRTKMYDKFVVILINCFAPLISLITKAIQELIMRIDLKDRHQYWQIRKIDNKLNVIVPEEYFHMTPEELDLTIDTLVMKEFAKH